MTSNRFLGVDSARIFFFLSQRAPSTNRPYTNTPAITPSKDNIKKIFIFNQSCQVKIRLRKYSFLNKCSKLLRQVLNNNNKTEEPIISYVLNSLLKNSAFKVTGFQHPYHTLSLYCQFFLNNVCRQGISSQPHCNEAYHYTKSIRFHFNMLVKKQAGSYSPVWHIFTSSNLLTSLTLTGKLFSRRTFL